MLAVEFGSGRRGDGDPTSDRDLLLIGDDWQHISAETRRRSAAGYSVSAFLTPKAAYLVASGSLFFKHICDEGVLVEGRADDYHSLTAAWQPAHDYRHEVYENLDLLEVLRFVPSSRVGFAASVDILISSVRNILIRRLANEGLYVFGWKGVFEAALRRAMIRRTDVGLFLAARSIKNGYRRGYIPMISRSFLDALVDAAGRACATPLALQFARRPTLRGLPERYPDRSYKQLRALELMCAAYEFEQGIAPFLSRVRQPAYFRACGI